MLVEEGSGVDGVHDAALAHVDQAAVEQVEPVVLDPLVQDLLPLGHELARGRPRRPAARGVAPAEELRRAHAARLRLG